MNGQGLIAYELRGKSLAAAMKLERRVRDYLQQAQPQQTGSLLDIHQDWQKHYRILLAQIRAEDPALLAACGLDKPTLLVEHKKGGWPRAYESYPGIYAATAEAPLYLMFCRTDYKGAHFVPEDAVLCDDKDFTSTDMGHGIYKKRHWIAEGPVIDGGRRGVKLPPDYTPPAQDETEPAQNQFFLAGGQTLAAITRYEQKKQLFSRRFEAFRKALDIWADKNMPGHYANMSLRHEKGRNVLTLSFREKDCGEAQPLMHPDWLIDKQVERDWRDPETGEIQRVILNEYEVRPSPATAESRILAMMFKMIPPLPEARSIPELTVTTKNGPVPAHIHRYPEGVFLNFYTAEQIAPPPGCVPADAALFAWLRADEEDRMWNIELPPRPAAFTAALEKLYGRKGPAAPRPPQP